MAENPLSGMQKVALLLKSLPAETVDKVIKLMDPRQGKLLAAEVSKLANDPKLSEKLPNVLDEAVRLLGKDSSSKQERSSQAKIGPTPPPPVRESQSKIDTVVDLKIDDDLAARMTGAPAYTSASAADSDPLLALARVPADLLAAALESENGRTVFILMEKLRVDLAAQIYKNLSAAKRKEISLRFAEKSTVNQHIIKQIAQGVLKKCEAMRQASASATPEDQRQKLMATMIKGLERAERIEMLAALEKTDPALTERVKNLLYEFEVIARMENSSVQKLLAEVNMPTLAQALRGAPAEVEERLMSNLSKRAQETLREEMSLLGNVTPAKVREARQGIVQTIQQMDQRGEFLLRE